jgi:hypothetical protein
MSEEILQIGTQQAVSALSQRRYFTEMPKVIGQSIIFRLLHPQFRKVPSRIVPLIGADGSKYYAPFPDLGPDGDNIETVEGTKFSECPIRNRFRFIIYNETTERIEILETGVNLASRINNILADPDVGYTWDTAVFKLSAIPPRTPAIPRDYDVQIVPKRSGSPIPQDILNLFENEKETVLNIWGTDGDFETVKRRVEAWKGDESTDPFASAAPDGEVAEFTLDE